jgi:hypothetical protein
MKWYLILAVALTSVAAASAAPSASTGRFTPPHFEPSPGWFVGGTRIRHCPSVRLPLCRQASAWTATVRWRDCLNCIPPHRTLAALPANGVAIHLTRSVERKVAAPLTWPPRIRRTDVRGPVEGAPSRIASFQRFGQVGGANTSVFVFFGQRHPSADQLARAQAQLRAAVLR